MRGVPPGSRFLRSDSHPSTLSRKLESPRSCARQGQATPLRQSSAGRDGFRIRARQVGEESHGACRDGCWLACSGAGNTRNFRDLLLSTYFRVGPSWPTSVSPKLAHRRISRVGLRSTLDRCRLFAVVVRESLTPHLTRSRRRNSGMFRKKKNGREACGPNDSGTPDIGSTPAVPLLLSAC